ncbi:Pentatricopeptide repeat [Macleaya cordata]|uniref:Pentatricopeptide repeat n=1 Tax=Macleaya cordata TaxID=56857 RepID=A0A200QMK2_MACCD|nr:Pentatricopeptide repeat [Macleaya cordata]
MKKCTRDHAKPTTQPSFLSSLPISTVSRLISKIEKLVFYKRYEEALELFEILECEGDYDVGSTTYDALVDACIGLKSIRGVKRVFNYMNESRLEWDQYLRNRALLMHVKCGMMIDARRMFDEMPERNLVSWNTIILGLVDSGEYKEAFQLFLLMWREFSDAGSRTFTMMIKASTGLGLACVGSQLHSCVMKLGIDGDIFVSCALIDMYSKCGSIEDARSVFYGMPEKTVVGWNTIIAGYALNGYSEEALSMYYEMRDSGVKMDNFTYSIIIRICARLASLEHAKQAHACLVRHGFGSDMVANTALVDFYSKWGRIEDARRVFDKMPNKNVISWNALIDGYGNHGRGIEAVEMFERMLREGMVPNHLTFRAVLSACSYSGLSDRGWEIFESMTRDHKIKPRAMHFACMIGLLGKEGLLDEAFALIKDAPFRPTENMWAALLTACRVHKNLELGKFAAEKLYGMEPKKLSNYVVLLNIYNSSGRLEDAAGVINTLRRRGLRMLPACSWIEIKKQPHFFVSGDKSHIQIREIYQRLDKLMLEIAKHGYAPAEKSLLSDVDEQEERILSYHSEKLAIACGLINTSDSTSLQIVQSHRICSDCHSLIKLIAMVTRREIVIRDASRFHHFKDGTCSCRDYW